MVLAQVRFRARRSAALFVAVLLATLGFTVLSGSTETARLQVLGAVDEGFRPTYDILVRPAGSRSGLESSKGLVMPGFLAGTYGGITEDAWRRIAAVPDVEVAAPLAMVGNVPVHVHLPFDVTDSVDPAAESQLLRLYRSWRYDRGLSRSADRKLPVYVYVTRHRLLRVARYTGDVTGPGTVTYEDGSSVTFAELFRRCGNPYGDGSTIELVNFAPPWEVRSDGTRRPLCLMKGSTLRSYQRLPDGRYRAADPVASLQAADRPRFDEPARRLSVPVVASTTLSTAGIDPAAEARLLGLDAAMVSGRRLSPGDTAQRLERPDPTGGSVAVVPTIISTRPGFDQQLVTPVEVLPEAVARDLAGSTADEMADAVEAAPTTAGPEPPPADLATAFPARVGQDTFILFREEAGLPSYAVSPDGGLRPRKADAGERDTFSPVTDVPFRDVRSVTRGVEARVVGQFDPDRLPAAAGLRRLGVDAYLPVRVDGADPRSARLLGGRQLQRSSDPAGYVGAPPVLLVNLRSLPVIYNTDPDFVTGVGATNLDDVARAAAPISAVRVRVGGVERFDEAARERVRLVAERIAVATGLEVDIMTGSSPAAQAVTLAAGAHGRPELRLTEWWSKKGVAAAIITAVDRKSLVLFVLVLLVCGLFLGNATWAAVRSRERELAVLACVGWPARRLATLVLAEVAVIGLVAGGVAAAVALPVGALVGVRVSAWQALVAVPAALALSLIAAWFPAWRAGRASPISVVRSGGASAVATGSGPRTVLGLALRNLRRVPGRTAVGAAALGVAVCALTLLAAVLWSFQGTAVGTVLGTAVSVSVRGVDLVAVAAMVVFGLVAVADVQYLNVRERAAEFAVLRSLGWPEAVLARLVVAEGVAVGVLGAVLGAGTGLLAAVLLTGQTPAGLYPVVAGVAAAGVLLAAVAAAIPAAGLRRANLAVLLSDE
ncbi:MAG TPA: FtsX-like permease family protein [Pilimelia sp.]|nr:FtsX-like permease family protein [Pilimelia sp.]